MESGDPLLEAAVEGLRSWILERVDTLTMRGVRAEIIRTKGLDADHFTDDDSGGERRREAVRARVDAIVKPYIRSRQRREREAKAAPRADERKEVRLSHAVKLQIDMCKRAGLSYAHCFKGAESSEAIEGRLAGVLERGGLSLKSTHAEVKAVKKARARAKELEGIDVKNVIPSAGGRKGAPPGAGGHKQKHRPKELPPPPKRPAAEPVEEPASKKGSRRLVLDDDDDDDW